MRAAALALAFALLAPAGPFAATAAAQDAEALSESREILVMLRMPAPHFRPNARYGGRYDDRAAQEARRRVAAEIARDNGLELVEGWPMPLIGVDCYVMRVPDGQSVEEAIAKVSGHSMVDWSQPLNSYETLAAPVPSDPLYSTQPAASFTLCPPGARGHEPSAAEGVHPRDAGCCARAGPLNVLISR